MDMDSLWVHMAIRNLCGTTEGVGIDGGWTGSEFRSVEEEMVVVLVYVDTVCPDGFIEREGALGWVSPRECVSVYVLFSVLYQGVFGGKDGSVYSPGPIQLDTLCVEMVHTLCGDTVDVVRVSIE